MNRIVNPIIAAAAVAATVLPASAGGPRAWWVLPLALASSVPVLWRERALLPVGLIVGTATTVSASLGAPPLLPVGPLVCLYTFAARAALPTRLLGIAVTAAGLLVSVLYPRPDLEVLRYLTVAYIFAYALGTGTRARRNQASALAERERRVAGEREAAVLRERTRISRDLHDIVTHALGIMIVQAEAGPLLVRSDPARADAAFEAIAATGRDAVVQLRRAVGGLRPPPDDPLEQPGLVQLPALVKRVRTTGLDASLEMAEMAVAVPADVGVALYRIVQEALTNVVRHAAARSVRVLVDCTGEALTVSVIDDGRGAAVAGPPGFGIVGMGERAQACGGTFHAGPAPGGGFEVNASLPLPIAAMAFFSLPAGD
ncbi:sensor histidine kinase [Actinoplanes sp. HUAS TT8]|uniref:sensor histidine kinase n=1 Tax=Actinoplanes sp. HUAS TT8 TaxID=3447453 RepID=UPI003F525CC2